MTSLATGDALSAMRVLRVYHSGRDRQHRGRERALARLGVDVTVVVPTQWPEGGGETTLSAEPFRIVELPVRRAGDVNRHFYSDESAIRRLLEEIKPDVLDLHEEPFSSVARQWLRAASNDQPVVMFTAQNIDKRYPPPYCFFEEAALRRTACMYPCTRQAASVARGKGFAGHVRVVPLGYDDAVFRPGKQALSDGEVTLVLAGRLVKEKGVLDAVRVLERVHASRPARLVLVGHGPFAEPARSLAASLGVEGRLAFSPWLGAEELASLYREAHVLLVPSTPTSTWTEQFGRVIVEAQASGAVVAGYATGAIAETAGEAGVVVAPGEVEHLAERVTDVISDADRYSELRNAGLHAVGSRAWTAVAREQLELYETALAGDAPRVAVPTSPRARRARARSVFGQTAPALFGVRPFAVAYLRGGGTLARTAAAVVDFGAELRARLAATAR
jgi:glycosyltransferase involved in cell wall biosynthesis